MNTVMTTKRMTADVDDFGLRRGEHLIVYKNLVTGDILYSTNFYNSAYIDGQGFITVFPKPHNKQRRPQLMRKDSLEKVYSI